MGQSDRFECGVCGGGRFKTLSQRRAAHPLWWMRGYPDHYDMTYVLCPDCGHVTLFPRFSGADYDAIYRHTPGLPREQLARGRTAMLDDRRAFIRAHAPDLTPGRVIEVGPAYGDFLTRFPEAAERIGLEPSSQYRAWVAENRPELRYLPTLLEDAEQGAPDIAASADLAMACQVLEHAAEPRVFMTRLAALARPGGFVFVEVPSLEGMAALPEPLFQNLYYGHVSQFTKPVILRLGAMAFLDPVRIDIATDRDYPVIRALFRKGGGVAEIERLFAAHDRASVAWAERAAARWRALADAHPGTLLVWGIGQDFFDAWCLLPEAHRDEVAKRLCLVDRNAQKQGHAYAGRDIVDPDAVDGAPALVVVASRSELVRKAILKDAEARFPGTPTATLY